MNKTELLKLAGQYFISDAGLSTANLIRKVQIAEGHLDCFATGKTRCDQMMCRWRKDCLGESSETVPVEIESTVPNKNLESSS